MKKNPQTLIKITVLFKNLQITVSLCAKKASGERTERGFYGHHPFYHDKQK
jgi:hypothetical protein